jgi:hypothetical protein
LELLEFNNLLSPASLISGNYQRRFFGFLVNLRFGASSLSTSFHAWRWRGKLSSLQRRGNNCRAVPEKEPGECLRLESWAMAKE